MILQCSQCNTRYLAPDHAIGVNGRTVRCANCKHTWFATLPAGTPPPAMPDLDAIIGQINEKPRPIPAGSNLPVAKRQPAPMGLKITVGVLAASVAALAVLVFSPSLYGLPHSKDMALAEVNMLKQTKDKRASYEISGKIVNSSEHTHNVPTLRITLIDKEGSSLEFWEFSGGGNTLEAGKNIPFTTGPLLTRFSTGERFVVELGNSLELALRKKPE